MQINKKNILLLTSEFPPLPGGIGNHACNIAEYLQKSGYDVSVIADQRDSSENEAKFDAQLQSKVYRIKRRKFRIVMYLQRLQRSFHIVKQADVLICSGKFPLWLGAILKRFMRLETIAIIHGTEVNFSSKRLKKSVDTSLKTYDKTIAVSNYTKQLVQHLQLQNITVIPNGYSSNDWHTASEIILKLEGHPKLLTVGNVTERKGQRNVIRHLPEVLKLYPSVHYHCVGFKTEVEHCINLAEKLDVLSHVTFHGHKTHEELKAFYKNTDICVMLSQKTQTGDVEGFGIALIEANHFGIPTIGSLGCGIEDAIANQSSGLLIENKNTMAFVNAIDTITTNKEVYESGAKAWAKQHDWSTIIKQYIFTIES